MAIRYRQGRKAPWVVYWKNPFTGKTEEFPCETEDQAKKENSLIKHRLKYERESFRPNDQAPDIQGDSLEACHYLYLKEKKFSKKSLTWQIDSMKLALRMIGQKSVRGITKQDLENVKQAHVQTGVKPTTVRGRMSVLRTILRWCVEKDIVEAMPRFPKLPPANYEKFIPPSPSELSKICSVASPHIVRVALLGAQLGVRIGPSELLKMEWSHIDLERGVARVRAANKRVDQPWREVPIKSSLIPVLREWKAEDDAQGISHLVTYRGKPLTTIQQAWLRTIRKAGIGRRIRPYDLRHAFATEAIAAGADLKTVAEIMGDDPKMLLEHYQHVLTSQKKKAVEALPEIVFTAGNYGKQKEDL